jgi:hypothetical protein
VVRPPMVSFNELHPFRAGPIRHDPCLTPRRAVALATLHARAGGGTIREGVADAGPCGPSGALRCGETPRSHPGHRRGTVSTQGRGARNNDARPRGRWTRSGVRSPPPVDS